MGELWGDGAKKNAGRQEDIGDKLLDVLAGDKGKKEKQKVAQKDWFASKVGGGKIFTPSLFSLRCQVNEMAGGGEAGELREDKLDKGMRTLLLGPIIGADGQHSDRSFPTAYLERGRPGKRSGMAFAISHS